MGHGGHVVRLARRSPRLARRMSVIMGPFRSVWIGRRSRWIARARLCPISIFCSSMGSVPTNVSMASEEWNKPSARSGPKNSPGLDPKNSAPDISPTDTTSLPPPPEPASLPSEGHALRLRLSLRTNRDRRLLRPLRLRDTKELGNDRVIGRGPPPDRAVRVIISVRGTLANLRRPCRLDLERGHLDGRETKNSLPPQRRTFRR